jgi:UDP-N-acetyl-D-glucosamine dehydrogenase
MKSIDLEGDLKSYDAAVIVTDHSAIDYTTLAEELDLVIDTRGIYRQPLPNVVKA